MNKNNGFLKVIALLVLVALIMPLSALAAAEQVLTLDEVKKLAVENSPEIKKQQATIELAKRNEKDAWLDYERARANYQNVPGLKDSLQSAMEGARDLYDARTYSKDDAITSLDQTKKKVEYDAENCYLTILNTEKLILLQEQGLKIQGRMVEIEKLKLQLGLSNQIQLDQQTQRTLASEKQLQASYDGLKTLKWQLNRSIGHDLDAYVLLAPVTFNPISYGSNAATEAKAKETYLALEQFNRTIEDKNKDIDRYRYDATDKIEKLNLEVAQIETQITDIEYLIKYNIKSIYEKAALSQEKMVDASAAYQTAQVAYQHQELQYQLGIIPKISFENAQVVLGQAETDYQKATYEYYLATREVKLAEDGIFLK